jgi:hypothetical protein
MGLIDVVLNDEATIRYDPRLELKPLRRAFGECLVYKGTCSRSVD